MIIPTDTTEPKLDSECVCCVSVRASESFLGQHSCGCRTYFDRVALLCLQIPKASDFDFTTLASSLSDWKVGRPPPRVAIYVRRRLRDTV